MNFRKQNLDFFTWLPLKILESKSKKYEGAKVGKKCRCVTKRDGLFLATLRYLLCKNHKTMKKANGRKSFISVKSCVLIRHFIRGYLVPLPP